MDPQRTGRTPASQDADTQELRRRGSLKWTAVDADIAAWVAESDLGTAPAVTAALHEAVDAGMLGYLPPAVRQGLGEACAAWHGSRYGWQVPAERIHPVADVLEALRVTVEHFSRPGSPVILPTPAYMPFVTTPAAWGREVIQVPMTAGPDGRPALDVAGIDAAFRAGGHLLVLTNPHNPTGRVLERAELLDVADVVQRHGGRVFSDEIHAPLVHPGSTHLPYASCSAAAAAHTVTATSASKAWNIPGLKCAQVLLSDEADAAVWHRVDRLLTHGASTPGVLANTAAYRHGGPWLDGLLELLDGNRQAFAAELRRAGPDLLGHAPPEGTYLAWVDLRPAFDGQVPADLGSWVRRRTGVAVVDGADCGAGGHGFVRVNLAMPRRLVVEAGRRIAAACLDLPHPPDA